MLRPHCSNTYNPITLQPGHILRCLFGQKLSLTKVYNCTKFDVSISYSSGERGHQPSSTPVAVVRLTCATDLGMNSHKTICMPVKKTQISVVSYGKLSLALSNYVQTLGSEFSIDQEIRGATAPLAVVFRLCSGLSLVQTAHIYARL